MAKFRSKGANVTIWVLMGLLIFGLGGFGVTNFGGGATAVATVNGRDVTANDYARALEQQLRTFSAQSGRALTLRDAQAMGLDAAVRNQLVGRALIDAELERIGLSAGDQEVQRQVLAISAFHGLDGKFDRRAYAEGLRRAGYTEAEFERTLRYDAARGVLQTAIASGVAEPGTFADTLVRYLAETRSATHVTLTEANLSTPVPEPGEAELTAWYDAHKDLYTLPEARRISYAWVTPDTLAPTVEVADAALRSAYDQRQEEFVQPERRLVERMVFGSEAEAQDAKARLDAGQITRDGLLAERRITAADIDLGDVSEAELGAAGAEVFALSAPGVVGPLPSDFGPALYWMNGILEAQNITFDEARDQLRGEVAVEEARRQITADTPKFDDLIAGGATVEELSRDTIMEEGHIDFRPDSEDGPAAYPEFRDAARTVQKNDFPRLIQLSDGGLAVLRLDEILPPQAIPFAEVRDRVAADWRHDAVQKALEAEAATLESRLAAGEAITALGHPAAKVEALRRDSVVEGTPAGFTEAVFALQPGARQTVKSDGMISLVQLDSVTPPDASDPDVLALHDGLAQQGGQSLSQDMFDYFSTALHADAKISFNQAVINSVHSRFP
ncbi:peptidylprolyl isomerase [Haematobacter missouriensis]|uniref:Peptidylprolyl isomerase n=1 Tax=Haematobacter missouriensis TaxID=366616 RepID=A0A212ASP9_9RHOB|nr:SurA N-terminal domain-containing protein [Haematobacter missouriensis]KFI32279.1 peptidylprolyl isomerase [Haematobacter missouriensis]OWJ75277.1 peptidylprolyl isomerase [Haematobacter missouriensis]OWJ84489.1 peptidylprolyl isomerase [Haematobacter missouriensis]